MNPYLTRFGVRTYLIASFAGVVVILTCVLAEYIGVIATDQIKSSIGQNLSELAYQTRDKLDRGMFERYREVQLLAAKSDLADPQMSLSAKRTLLEVMQATYPYYAWLGITDNAGTVLVASNRLLEGADVSQRPWFRNAHRNVNLTDVHEAALLAKLLPHPTEEPLRFFDVAFPYRDKDGKIAGIFGTHLSWQWATEIEQSVLRPLASRSQVETLILARDASVLLGPKELIGKKLPLSRLNTLPNDKTGFLVERWPDGKDYLVGFSKSQGYRTYPGLGWTILVRQSLDTAYRPVTVLQRQIVLGGCLVAALFSFFGLILARRIAYPLRRIADSANKIEAGIATTMSAGQTDYREVRVLQGALQSLISKLQANEGRLSALNVTLEHRVEERTAALEEALATVQRNERRVKAIIDGALDAFVGVDSTGKITDWNTQAEQMFGWRREEVIGQLMMALIIPERYRKAHLEGMTHFLETGKVKVLGQRLQLTALRRGGDEFPIELTLNHIESDKGDFFSAFMNDITQRKQFEQQIAESREHLAMITDNMPALISYVDHDQRYQFNNKTYETWFRRPRRAIYGKMVKDVLDEKAYVEVAPYIQQALNGERVVFEMTHDVGQTTRHAEATYIPHWNTGGKVVGFYVMVHDVTERKRQEIEFERLATRDALTGLPNRRACLERLREAIHRVSRNQAPLAILFLDVDNFKQVNDTYGHDIGDKVLIAFADRLTRAVRKTDLVARLAGDEFVVIAEGLPEGAESVRHIAEKIIAAMATPWQTDDLVIASSTSIGITLCLDAAVSPDRLLKEADAAMYRAKQQGGNAYCFHVASEILFPPRGEHSA